MTKILKVNKTSDYSGYHGVTDRHPLITVIDFSEISPIRHSLNRYGVYGVFVQEDNDLDRHMGAEDMITGTARLSASRRDRLAARRTTAKEPQ